MSVIINSIDIRITLRRMVIGYVIGMFIISLFVFSVDTPNPDWSAYWWVRPLVITPLAAAFGMLSFHLANIIKPQANVMKIITFFISLLGFIVTLWLGIVLGLDGTLWN